jgi:hypothetical protein
LKRPLADGVTTKQQADDEIHEDQLLNYLVNTLTGAFSLNLGENAGSTPTTSSRSSSALSQAFGMCIHS